jgi:phospholipase/lecithinase/hemolysin
VTTFSVIYSFGDSLSDAGNAWLLTNTPYASGLGLSPTPVSPPYYQEVYNSVTNTVTNTVTANVFSDGLVWTQDLASSLGLGVLAPSGVGAFASVVQAALTPTLGAFGAAIEVGQLEAATGVSGSNPYIPLVAGVANGTDFAVGGAVTGPTAINSALSQLDGLSAQLSTFKRDVPTPQANALATVSIGGNDILAILNAANFSTIYGTGTTLGNVAATAAGTDVAQSVALEATFLSGLISTGVTNIVVMNVPDIGTTPEALAMTAAQDAAGTVLSAYYNQLLAADINALNQGQVTIKIDDAFSMIDSVVANPSVSGLTNVTTPVYSGDSSTFVPADLATTITANWNQYLFFDTIHPTETGQTGLAQQALLQLTACFATGTRILTTEGEVPVEDLRPGTRAVLADGGSAPIIWIGHREVDCAREPVPAAAWPIRVQAGAFGPGRPCRDLFLSPDHAVFHDGVLIPVKHLVNGTSINRAPRDQVTWWHVELSRHDVLLADGLPCESFLDTGARDDDGTRRARRADYVGHVWEASACAELVVAGPRLERARSLLSGGSACQ